MPPLRIALIGAGWVTAHHLDAYAAMPSDAVVVAVADPDTAAREARMEGFGIARGFDDAEAMLDALAGEIDAVDIASPREHHARHVALAVARGLPVLCQKPLAPDLAAAKRLVAELPAEARVMVHENWRFRPHYRTLARWIEAGRIGPPRQAIMRILTSGLVAREDGSRPALVRQPMMRGLDRMLLMEVMIHHVDALRFLLGPMQLLAARMGRDCSEIRGEDRATLMIAAGADGATTVTLVGDFMAHGRPAAAIDRLDLLGLDGAITLDDEGLWYRVGEEVVEHVPVDFAADYKASYRDAIAHFLAALRSGDPFETDPRDNLATLRIIEQAYAAAGPPGPA
ncbi:putative dehydrogenase [Palleronia aestuarii]|uniref:Putative dehydrogenase n=1 Tax=Palleronia aestuarii TaxID=568105 RepID=A0A2W7NAS8_9RHOB|nr:Gfo/Idh/MocA family oxidoreductase [Palleronia aestuarii]PZX17198.1 putative dehydrogenase [Palleronia aestuarii]